MARKKTVAPKKQEESHSFSIEKGDVDISKLFEFQKEVLIKGANNKAKKVYMRLPGDAEVNRAKVQAIRLSTELRKNLKNPEWEDREAYIPYVGDLNKETIEDLILSYSVGTISTEVIREVQIPHPKEPKATATLEEQEKYQKAVDEYPELVKQRVTQQITNRLERLKTFLESKTLEELVQIHNDELIKDACNQLLNEKFIELCAYFSVFKDKKFTTPLFESYDEFAKAPKLLKDQILRAYFELDLTSEQLKKSLEATP